MYKKMIVIVGIPLCVILFWLYTDEITAYNDGKFYFETVGEYGHTLSDAHEQFIKANGLWNSEIYIKKIEDESYSKMKEISDNNNYSSDGVWSYINILKTSKRYKNNAEYWEKEFENFINTKQRKLEERIAINPPYEGMPRGYVTKTSWGEPTRIKKSYYPSDTIDNVTYFWDYYTGDKRKVRAVYVADGEVIKVSDYYNY